MSRIALGTVQFGIPYGIANKLGQISRSEAKLILKEACAYKIDTLDTAISYGESESCLGEAGVKNFKVVTKLPSISEGCVNIENWVEQQIEGSLHRLGINKIFGLLLHQSIDLLGSNGYKLYRALNSLKEKGFITKIGVSIYSPNELELLSSNFTFDLVQLPFNVIDRRFFCTGWMQRLKDDGVEIHTRSAFLQGLLLMRAKDIPLKFSSWKHILKKWHDWLDENNISALQASLAYPLSFSEIDRVVVGIDSQSQLFEIINASNNLLNVEFPNLSCEDENFINPSNWSNL